MKIFFDKNYPKYLVDALQLIHKLDTSHTFNIDFWEKHGESRQHNPVVFILDRGKKGLDISTQKHFEAGYRVFALKLNTDQKMNLFNFSLTVLNLWPKMLDTVKENESAFVYTYKYEGIKLRKVA